MSAFVPDISNSQVQSRSDLTLNRGIPLVDGWEPLRSWPDSWADVARRSPEWKNAIRGNRNGHKTLWALGQGKYGAAVIRCPGSATRALRAVRIGEGLVSKDRQILSHDVAEVGTKHADVKTAPIPDAQNSFRIKLICKAETGCERFVGVLHIPVQVV